MYHQWTETLKARVSGLGGSRSLLDTLSSVGAGILGFFLSRSNFSHLNTNYFFIGPVMKYEREWVDKEEKGGRILAVNTVTQGLQI